MFWLGGGTSAHYHKENGSTQHASSADTTQSCGPFDTVHLATPRRLQPRAQHVVMHKHQCASPRACVVQLVVLHVRACMLLLQSHRMRLQDLQHFHPSHSNLTCIRVDCHASTSRQ